MSRYAGLGGRPLAPPPDPEPEPVALPRWDPPGWLHPLRGAVEPVRTAPWAPWATALVLLLAVAILGLAFGGRMMGP